MSPAAGRSAILRPPLNTTTRVATSTTSAMLWLIRITVVPPRCNSRMRSSTWRLSATPSAAVGSSMITSRAFQWSARAIATACRCPPDSRSIGAIGVADVDLEPREITRRRVAHRTLVEDAHAGHELPGELRPDEHVLPDREPGGEREILVDRRHTSAQRIDRRAEHDGPPFDLDTAFARLVRTRDDADQRRLAGAVVAADRDDLAGFDVEVDAAQRLDRAVALADADEAKQRRQADDRRARLLQHLVDVRGIDEHRVHPQIRSVDRLVLRNLLDDDVVHLLDRGAADALEGNADGRGQQAVRSLDPAIAFGPPSMLTSTTSPFFSPCARSRSSIT